MDDHERNYAGVGWGPMLDRYEAEQAEQALNTMRVRYLCEVAPLLAKAATIMGEIDALARDDRRPDVAPGEDWEFILTNLVDLKFTFEKPKEARARSEAYLKATQLRLEAAE